MFYLSMACCTCILSLSFLHSGDIVLFFLDLLLMFEQHCRFKRHDHATSDKAGNSCFLPLYLKIAFLPIASIRTKNLTHLLFSLTVQAFIPFDHYHSVST